MKSSIADELVDQFYDAHRSIRIAKREPLYWIQASIAKTANNNFLISDNYIASARSVAKTRYGYDTYQIDTHEAKFLIESRMGGYKDDYGDALLKSVGLILQVLTRHDDDLVQPLEVVTLYSDYYLRFRDDIDEVQTAKFIKELVEISDKIGRYSSQALRKHNIGRRAKTAIDLIKSAAVGYA